MSKAVLLFLVIVLAGANLALLMFGREPARVQTVAAPAVPEMQAAVSSSQVATTSERAHAPTKVATVPPPAVATPGATPTPTEVGDGELTIPVQGITAAQLHDTFNEARSQGRVHEALDIMAPRGTPVIAVADGTVEKLFTSVPGGLTIYQFEPTGRYAYYYAHLDRYADGLQEKQAIKRGEVIGYVGSTGNADPSAPHLHFAIFELGPERQWWKGTAINPYPVFARSR